MGSPHTDAQFVRLLSNTLREVADNKYQELPKMIPTFFRTLTSDAAWEEFFSVGAIPDIPESTGRVSYLNLAPGYHAKIEPKEYFGGVMVQRKLMDDKKYSVLSDFATKLMTAAVRTQEKLGAKVFNNSFSTAFDFMTSEEGVSLCSSSHTTKSGTSTTNGFDNSGTSALSATSLAATVIAMKQFRNDISERIDVGDRMALVVPTNLTFTAQEIVNTTQGLDTAHGNVNVHYNKYEIITYPRLDDSDTNNWFLVDLDKMKEALVWIDRIKPQTNTTVDFETYITKISNYFRCAYGFLDWRWCYGHTVT